MWDWVDFIGGGGEERERGDLIQVFKIIKGFDKVNPNVFFQFSENSRTRGHRYKIVKTRPRLEIQKISLVIEWLTVGMHCQQVLQ